MTVIYPVFRERFVETKRSMEVGLPTSIFKKWKKL